MTHLYLVLKPGKEKTPSALCYRADAKYLKGAFGSWLKPEQVSEFFTTKREAYRHAEQLLLARDFFEQSLKTKTLPMMPEEIL